MTFDPTEILSASILIVDDQESNIRLLEQVTTTFPSPCSRARSARCIGKTSTT
jgi:CheY-like chemotaxis protein